MGIDESGDVLIGGRIGRVGVDDVEDAGDDEEGPKIFVFLACSGVVDGATLNSFPGEKAGALGLSTVVGGWSCFCSETATVDVGSGGPALGSIFGVFIFLGNPDGALCEAEMAEDDGASNAAAGVSDVDGIAGLEKGDPKVDTAVPWFPMFAKAGADVDAPKGEKEELASTRFGTTDGTPTVPEVLGAEEVEPKADEDVPKGEEELPNADPVPKPRFAKTFGVVLRFANAEVAGGMELAVEGTADPDVGLEGPKAVAGGVPKAEVDEPVPTMIEGEGRTPKESVSHSVALGFSGWGWC